MNTKNIDWHDYLLESLPEVLFGHSKNNGDKQFVADADPYEDRVRLGFVSSNYKSSYHPPSLMIVDDNKAAPVFSWLKVYAQETFPVSQFCRILSTSDWERFKQLDTERSLPTLRFDKWANVILGELLSLADGETDLASLPLSRAAACFSTAMSKAHSLYLRDSAVTACFERLVFIEKDSNFIKRSLLVNDLLPIWNLMSLDIGQFRIPQEIAILIADASVKLDQSNLKASHGDLIHLGLYPALFKDSIEDRVHAFNLLANDLSSQYQKDPKSIYANAVLAAGAVLVGRGTSHGFLLNKWLSHFKTSFTWFGLMASMMEPRYWDVNWSKNVKGIEKYVRTSFDWSELNFSDLSWLEYFWISRTFQGVDTLNEIPKMLSKVLTIEIIPGVTCQLRLNNPIDEKSIASNSKDVITPELKLALQDMIAIADKVRGSLNFSNALSQKTQNQNFALEKTSLPKSKVAPRRKK